MKMSDSDPDKEKENRPVSGGPSTSESEVTSGPSNCRTRDTTRAEVPRALSRANQQGTPIRPKSRCWWCCCSFCCSTPGKKNDENGPTRNSNNSDLLNYEGDQPYSMEDIKSWGRSFDKLMKSSAGRKVFRDFLKCEYSEENILFWLACEELKREENPEVVEEMARIIYEDYISILSPKEVSLDAQVREIVNRNMVKPTPHTFDDAQLQIYTLMHRDSYPRFVNSPLYKSLIKQIPSQPKSEGANPPD